MSWHREDSKRRVSLQHSDRKFEVLHCVERRRLESVWTRVCWENQATSQGRRTRGSVQGIRWRSDTTSAEADGQHRESDRVDSERHDR